MQTTLPYWFDL